jgi:hypothetical protein
VFTPDFVPFGELSAMMHTLFKVLASFSPMMGGLGSLAMALKLIEAPVAIHVGGTSDGINKLTWAATETSAATGLTVTEQHVCFFIAACKLAAMLDLWVTKLVPRLALVCLSIMMLAVAYAHLLLGDDLVPPFVVLLFNLLALATWPSSKVNKGMALKAASDKAMKKKSAKAI